MDFTVETYISQLEDTVKIGEAVREGFSMTWHSSTRSKR